MGRLIFIAVLTLLYLQWGDTAAPIPSGKEHVFSYGGVVQALNLEHDYVASQWNISAKLIMQSSGDKIVMKFDDIKTSLGNGYAEDIESTSVLPIPEEAHKLYLPFVVHYHKNGSVSSLSYHSDDELWSLNMKRAIASIIQIYTENVEHLELRLLHEQNIHGSCEVRYSIDKQDTGHTLSKKIVDCNCRNSFIRKSSKTRTSRRFQPATANAVRTYKFVRNDGIFLLTHIKSSSNITSQTMSSERSSLRVAQSQVFELLSDSAISKPVDVSKVTESTALIYFLKDDDTTSGRHVKKAVDPEKLMIDLKRYYEEFKTDLHKYPLVSGDLGVNNSLMYIYDVLSQMDEDTMDITAFTLWFFADEETLSIFVSQLPYIGTNATVHLIENVVKSGALNNVVAIKLMAIFPNYVNDYNEDLLKKMEVLLDLKEVENKQVKNAGIMCFANLLVKASDRGQILEKTVKKYYTVLNKHFKNAANYEDKMVYLLGLINMGKLLHVDHMLPIITDKEQSHYIRSLATYGFKPFLMIESQYKKVFEQLWSIVKDHEEHFEVRVAVLDLLMSSALTQEEFDIIIAEFNKKTDDQVEQHLQNYLATTLQSLQNTTMHFSDYLNRKASESAEHVTIPSYYDTWGTGNYRVAYTDDGSNFGSYVQARLVANPITNMVNLVQLSTREFAMSLTFGTYSAYIRLDGVVDALFAKTVLNDRPNYDIAIPQLVELLKKFNYKLIEDLNMHIEVVLFCDDTVVFGMHINKDNVEEYTDNPLFKELLKLLVDYESVTYPKMYSTSLWTDLGTYVESYISETDVVSHKLKTDLQKLFDDSEIKHATLNYRSSRYESIVLETYNPLMDVNINVYKYKSNAVRIHLPFAVNVTGEYFTFDNINDTINVMVDRKIGMSVDDSEKLVLFGDCDAIVEIPYNWLTPKMLQLEHFGIVFNVTSTGIPAREITSFSKLTESYQSNTLAIPLAEPLSFIWYQLDYNYYLGPEISGISFRSKAFYEEPTENVWEWNFDIEDVYDENDIINGTELTAYSRISCRKKHDAKILSSIGTSYSYTDAPMTHEKSGSKHVEQKHKFRADYNDDDTHYIVCFDREIQYPSRKSDKWSINPVEPAKGKGRFSTGTTDEAKSCSNDFSITFTDIFESSEKLVENVKNMKEYKTCKKDSAGLKYIPPTDACNTVHDAVSKYSNYTLYVDLKNAGKFSKLDKKLRRSDRGMKFLQMYYVQDDVARFMISKDFFDALGINISVAAGVLDNDVYLGVFSGIEDPTAIAYDDYDAIIGISSTCDITPSEISTFTGKEIKDYESKDGKEIVAYVECFDKTRGGMTIQKFSDKKIGFTMWSGNDTLITSVAGNKLKVILNGEELHEQYTSDQHFKVYFLEDDVLYITNHLVQVYYNTEYISVKTPSLYNNYVCGLCAHVNKFNTENQSN